MIYTSECVYMYTGMCVFKLHSLQLVSEEAGVSWGSFVSCANTTSGNSSLSGLLSRSTAIWAAAMVPENLPINHLRHWN